MKKQNILIVLLPLVMLSYNNCSQTPFGGMGGLSADNHSSTGSWQEPETNKVANPYALLSAEQVLKSYASVAGVPISAAIMTEYNNRNTILSVNNNLDQSTAPMMIGLANIAGRVCDDLLAREVGLAADSRRFFNAVNFGSGVNNLSEATYLEVIDKMGLSFWGRMPAAAEDQAFKTARTEFIQALNANQQNAAASTRNLLLMSCTAMLTSFDGITF